MTSPAKKAKTSSTSGKKVTLNITAPSADSEDCRPFIVDDTSLTEGRIDFDLFKRKESRKAHHRMLMGETPKTNVKACNFGDQTGVNQDYSYIVCVVDQETGAASVYDAEMFVSQRTVKILDEKEAEAAASEAPSRSTTPAQDYRAAKTLLGETFGTKKVKQAINSQERNQINVQQLESTSAGFINRNLDKSIGRIQEASSAEASETSSVASPVGESAGILPPYNDKTNKVEEIYQIKDIVSNEAYYALAVEDFSEDSTESWEALRDRFGMTDFVLDRIRNAVSMQDAGHRLRCLLYLHYLLKLRELKEGSLNSEAGLAKGLPGASQTLISHLLESFTEPVSMANGQVRRKLSALCKDRIVSYICILLLLIEDGFRVNLTVLSTVLHIPVTRMTDHFKAVGCIVDKPAKGDAVTYTPPGQTRSLQIKYAQLKAPLAFPKPKRGPMK